MSNARILSKLPYTLSNVDNTSDVNKPVSTATQTALNLKADSSSLTSHTGNTSNPHSTTAAQVGLGNVDNTSDVNKPVSTATQTALNLKANLASPTFTGTVAGITKTMVGLGNVDNTSDASKPVSTAQSTAIGLKLDATHAGTGGTSHANVIAGGNAGFMTGADKTKLDGIATSANNYTHPANHAPSIITQDSSNRFVTDTEKTTWNSKADSSSLTSHTGNTSNPHSTTAAQVGAPTTTGTGASGSWGISITGSSASCTGNAATATTAATCSGNAATATAAARTYGVGGTTGNFNTHFGECPNHQRNWTEADGGSNAPAAGWWFIENMRHSNATNTWGRQYAHGWEGQADRLFTRNVSGGNWGSWYEFITTKNQASQPVNTATQTALNLKANLAGPVLSSASLFAESGNSATAGSMGNQILCNAPNAAGISFHRSGAYAVNMALDNDNVFRIGGWSASANRLQLDMSGNFTVAGNVTAYSDDRLKTNWIELPTDIVYEISKVKSGIYTRTDDQSLQQIGVSAQSLRNILPQAVIEDNNHVLSVAYGNVALSLCIELAKEIVKIKEHLASRDK
jgi:hypothetical protein